MNVGDIVEIINDDGIVISCIGRRKRIYDIEKKGDSVLVWLGEKDTAKLAFSPEQLRKVEL
jgi:hypothetical protein